jgi:hypothetical protein
MESATHKRFMAATKVSPYAPTLPHTSTKLLSFSVLPLLFFFYFTTWAPLQEHRMSPQVVPSWRVLIRRVAVATASRSWPVPMLELTITTSASASLYTRIYIYVSVSVSVCVETKMTETASSTPTTSKLPPALKKHRLFSVQQSQPAPLQTSPASSPPLGLLRLRKLDPHTPTRADVGGGAEEWDI